MARCPVAPPRSAKRRNRERSKAATTGRGTQLSKSMHPAQKTAPARIGFEEVVEQGSLPAEGLRPARRAFAHGVLQMRPHGKQRLVGIEHVSGQRERAMVAKVGLRDGLVGVNAVPLARAAPSPRRRPAGAPAARRAGVAQQARRQGG